MTTNFQSEAVTAPHPNTLLEIIDGLLPHLPLDKDALQVALGIEWVDKAPQDVPLHFESNTRRELACGTHITHTTVIPAGQNGVTPITGFALENAKLTLQDLEQRYGKFRLLSSPSPYGSGPGRMWQFAVMTQKGEIRLGFADGVATLSNVLLTSR